MPFALFDAAINVVNRTIRNTLLREKDARDSETGYGSHFEYLCSRDIHLLCNSLSTKDLKRCKIVPQGANISTSLFHVRAQLRMESPARQSTLQSGQAQIVKDLAEKSLPYSKTPYQLLLVSKNSFEYEWVLRGFLIHDYVVITIITASANWYSCCYHEEPRAAVRMSSSRKSSPLQPTSTSISFMNPSSAPNHWDFVGN